MALSEDEQGRLREIETRIVAADPAFARRLDLAAAARRRSRQQWMCWAALAVGALLMIAGGGAAYGVISIGTALAVTGAALTLWAAVTSHSLHARRH